MFYDYVGTLSYPWKAATDHTTVLRLQLIWGIVFPKIMHRVAVCGDPVFYLVRNNILRWLYALIFDISLSYDKALKKVDHWLQHFGDAGEAALLAYWDSIPAYQNDQARAEYATRALAICSSLIKQRYQSGSNFFVRLLSNAII